MSGYTTTWGQALCQRLGVPASLQNDLFFRAWAQAEGGTAKYNPFNTTAKMPGSTTNINPNGTPNSAGVQDYISAQQGFEATIKTLQNGKYNSILSALMVGTSARNCAYALEHSLWGTGGLALKIVESGKVSTFPVGAYPYPSPPLTVRLPRVQPGKLNIDIFTMQRALHTAVGLDYSHEPSYFGTATRAAYSAWQKKLGYTGADADGAPGIKSLTALGAKYGFPVSAT